MSNSKKKVVQTELELSEYETLVTVAKSKDMTLKEAAKEALRSWAASSIDLTKDPLFRLKPVRFRVKVRADEIEAFLYKGSSRFARLCRLLRSEGQLWLWR